MTSVILMLATHPEIQVSTHYNEKEMFWVIDKNLHAAGQSLQGGERRL